MTTATRPTCPAQPWKCTVPPPLPERERPRREADGTLSAASRARAPGRADWTSTAISARIVSRAAIAATTAALLACAPSTRVHPRVMEEVSKGYQYLSKDDLERAEIAFAHALEFNGDVPEALNGAGVVERRRGHVDDARRRFEHAVKIAPDFAEGHVNLGELDLVGERYEAAEADFRAALRVDPDLMVARLNLARALLHRGRRDLPRRTELWAAARRQYLHLLEAQPANAEAHHDLGFMDYLSGAYGRAAAEYGRAVEIAPDHMEALHGSCISLVRLGRCEEARRACRRCVELHPSADRCAASLRGALACE